MTGMYSFTTLLRVIAGANVDLGDWLCKILGICV